HTMDTGPCDPKHNMVELHSLELPHMENLKALVDGDASGYAIARGVIKRHKAAGRFDLVESLGYGEINVAAFGELLRRVAGSADAQRDVFVDIGSGTGKAVLAASVAGFKRCIGVEIVRELDQAARTSLERLRAMPLVGDDDVDASSKVQGAVEFIH